jgi:hypothetical protein
MAYSIIVWLINAGDQAHLDEAVRPTADPNRDGSPGAASGVNVPPVFNRFVYGLYQGEAEADAALRAIAQHLEANRPLIVPMRGNQKFLVPAARIHYVACAEAIRPKDDPDIADANRM